MDKLKKMFKKGQDGEEGRKSSEQSAASKEASRQQSTGAPKSEPTGSGAAVSAHPAATGAIPEGVIMHTTLGPITIALFRDQTPKVSRLFCSIAGRANYLGSCCRLARTSPPWPRRGNTTMSSSIASSQVS